MNRVTYTALAGLAACLTTATASAQPLLQHLTQASVSGTVSQVDVANLKANWVVSAVSNGKGNLQLTSWQYDSSTNVLTPEFTFATLSQASRVAITNLSSSRVVTATISAGNLELDVWSIGSNGIFSNQGRYVGEAAGTVDIARLSSERVVTAIRDSAGNLTLNVWGITSTGVINPKGSVSDVPITRASVTTMSNRQFVTAAQTSAGDLLVSSWGADSAGNITHQADSSKSAVTEVHVTPWSTAGHLAVACRNGSLNLDVIDYVVDATTGSITLEASKGGGAASKVAVSNIGTLIFSAAKDSAGKLRAGVWAYGGSTGTQFLELVSTELDTANIVAAASLGVSTQAVTASKNGAGNLELSVWQYDVIH